MSYKKVTDNIDVISSQLWKQLLNDFIDRCRGYANKNPYLNDIANTLSILPSPTSGKPVKPSLYNNMANACRELARTLGLEPPSDLRTVKTGDYVLARDVNALIDCLNMIPPAPTITNFIYLFNENDWNTAKNYVTDNSLIFIWVNISTLTSDEVQQLVNNNKVVFMVTIDVQPNYSTPVPAFYPVFYTQLEPTACDFDVRDVTDPNFQQFFGDTVPADWDFCVNLSQKVTGTKNWTGDSCGWGYKTYTKGAIMEIPYDGFWESPTWIANFVLAASNIFLGVSKPTRILYLAGYTTGDPDWHDCYPLDSCWQQFASQYGYQIVDLRG